MEVTMKSKKNVAVLLTVLVVACFVFHPAHAATEGITYSTVKSADVYANVNSGGLLSVSISYSGYNGITTGASITSYVQKQVLGLFWIKVDNGQPNNQWTDNVSGSSYFGSHTLLLSSSGTYRITAQFTMYATTGNESITRQSTIVY